jgi:diguanylate cyclase (GGDEF)-like protein
VSESDASRDHLILEAIQKLLLTGKLPDDLPAEWKTDPAVVDVVAQITELQKFAQTLANGDLNTELTAEGQLAQALKSLQANLRHMTWQVQRVAAGDLSQQVGFMGEFAEAFNTMIENLRQSHEALSNRARELSDGRRAALNLMLDAQAARREVEESYDRLQAQMEEINKLQEQLREQAIRDPLTGCFNRRYLEETLTREFSRSLRESYPLCLAMIDIDRFKLVNDTYSHRAGDAVLQALGVLLRGRTRAGDIVCRFGGEEFLIVLPNMPLDTALNRMDILRNEFQEMRVVFGEEEIHSTISIGVACCPLHGQNSEEVMLAADRALYRAKAAGRNCIRKPD